MVMRKLVESELLAGLPPSAKFVFKVLSCGKPMTLDEIIRETGLPPRTVKYALKRLRELELVEAVPCLKDLRRRIYMICYEATGKTNSD